MKPGDLVRFWDYDGGDGWVSGIILALVDKKYGQKLNSVPSVTIIYGGRVQTVPLESECAVEVISECEGQGDV